MELHPGVDPAEVADLARRTHDDARTTTRHARLAILRLFRATRGVLAGPRAATEVGQESVAHHMDLIGRGADAARQAWYAAAAAARIAHALTHPAAWEPDGKLQQLRMLARRTRVFAEIAEENGMHAGSVAEDDRGTGDDPSAAPGADADPALAEAVAALLHTYPPMDVAAAFGTALEARGLELDYPDLHLIGWEIGRSVSASLAGGL
ncbi:MAG: hypothetical protein AB1941_00815 [Gemmatimonadota bacterium]